MKHTMNRIFLLPLSFLLIFSGALSAQSSLGIRQPLGYGLLANSPEAATMGGVAVATSQRYSTGIINPADLGQQKNFATLGALFTLSGISLTQQGKSGSELLYKVFPQSFSFSVPMHTIGTFGFGFITKRRFDLLYTSSIETQEGSIAELKNVFNGNWQEYSASWGIEPIDNFSIGITYKRAFVKKGISVQRTIREGDVDRSISDPERQTNFDADAIRGGLLYSFNDFTLGFVGTYYNESEGVSEEIIQGRFDSTVSRNTFSIQIPPSLQFGASYTPNNKWLLGIDVEATLWKDYFTFSSHFEDFFAIPASVQDAFTVSAGLQYVPAPDALSPRYWQTIRYGAGLKYAQLELEGMEQLSGTISWGLPLSRGTGMIDIIFEGGRLIDSQFDGITENFFSVSIGINGGRNWVNKSSR